MMAELEMAECFVKVFAQSGNPRIINSSHRITHFAQARITEKKNGAYGHFFTPDFEIMIVCNRAQFNSAHGHDSKTESVNSMVDRSKIHIDD